MNKKRKLKSSVKKVIFYLIGGIVTTSLILAVYFTAVLQCSYKNCPPKEQETNEIRSNPISNWLFGKFIIDESEGN